MKKTLTLLLFVATASQFSFAQNIKVYNGPFNEGASFNGSYYDNEDKGTATYQYYENEKYERIYDGNFTYLNKKPYDPAYGSITSVIGQFKDNKKNGMWEYKITSLGLHDKIESIKVVKGKYINGKLDGLWTFKNIENGSNKILGESTVNFKNGVLVGKYEYNIGYSVKGSFDDNGIRIGEWVITYLDKRDKIEVKLKYENDAVVWLLKHNLASGEILQNNDYPNILSFWLKPSGWIASDVNPIFRWIIRGSDFIPFRNNISSEKVLSKEELVIKEEQNKILQAKKEQEREAEFEKQRKIREFENSDYGRLQNVVKTDFQAWLLKTEFETSTDYETRIKTQADAKFNTILAGKIESAQKRMLNTKYAKLGSYNPDNEAYTLTWGKGENATINVSKQIAQNFFTTFNNRKGGFDQSVIYVIPTQLIMINNSWKVGEAVVLFDNYWSGADFVRNESFKFFQENGDYYYQYDNYGVKKYKLIDIKTIQGEIIERTVFFYELKTSKNESNQSLNFTYQDLNITLPK